MGEKLAYNRILLKLSGEALSGDKGTGIDFDYVLKVSETIKKCVEIGAQITIVVGGGNYWRGRSNQHMDRTRADHIGMLATAMNALTLLDGLSQVGVDARASDSGAVYSQQGGKTSGKGQSRYIRMRHRQSVFFNRYMRSSSCGGNRCGYHF